MDEKELAGWLGQLRPYYSHMDYPKISVDPAIEGGDITVTRRVEEMPDTFWDHSGLDMNLDMNALAEIATKISRIRRGDQAIISAKTGYASSTVSEVLSGKYSNIKIVNQAFKITNPRKAVKA